MGRIACSEETRYMSRDDNRHDKQPACRRWPWDEFGVNQWELRLRREALEGRALMEAWLAEGRPAAKSDSLYALRALYYGDDYD